MKVRQILTRFVLALKILYRTLKKLKNIENVSKNSCLTQTWFEAFPEVAVVHQLRSPARSQMLQRAIIHRLPLADLVRGPRPARRLGIRPRRRPVGAMKELVQLAATGTAKPYPPIQEVRHLFMSHLTI